jgi:sugar phosphate isomerase/epimerase
MKVGVTTRSFPRLTNAQAAEMIAANGFAWVELCLVQTDSNYWVYNGRSDMSGFSDRRGREVVAEYLSRGLQVPALGAFTNLLEPDEGEWRANMAYFERLIQIAAINGIPVVATECGFIPGQRGINAERYESAFEKLKRSLHELSGLADRYGVDIALEPCVLDVVPSAKRTADLLRQVGSPRLRVLLDPANLIANNTEEEMFSHLAPHIAYIHGKDRKVNDAKGRIIGDGDIDWRKFIRLYRRHTPDAPFILEYVNADNFCAVRDRVLEAARDAGSTEQR